MSKAKEEFLRRFGWSDELIEAVMRAEDIHRFPSYDDPTVTFPAADSSQDAGQAELTLQGAPLASGRNFVFLPSASRTARIGS